MYQDYKFTPGKALIICGPQGSGKTSLALKIAKSHGKYLQSSATVMDNDFALSRAVLALTRTVIIEEALVRISAGRAMAKKMARGGVFECHIKGRDPEYVTLPFFIFTKTAPFGTLVSDRYFDVIDLGG